ncbi:hypothetical protein DGMP_21860 [Desulfomarina profundi]|uniref:AAA domain-containing protein n=1 Tax=Desulfomarina profundi TaxID=2772557 RepID=A0A8D5FM13_9BACT|nr:hypothetical protein DGMP_21860 [Desulfomarina profundi]
MYKRNSEKLIKELLQDFRILYLTGPRQAKKTTLTGFLIKSKVEQHFKIRPALDQCHPL